MKDAGVQIVRLPHRSPNLNAYAGGVTIFRVEDDKIVELRDHLDTELMTVTWPD